MVSGLKYINYKEPYQRYKEINTQYKLDSNIN